MPPLGFRTHFLRDLTDENVKYNRCTEHLLYRVLGTPKTKTTLRNTYWVGLGRLFLWYLFIIIFVAKVMYDANRQGMIECNSLRLVLIRAPI